MKQPNILFLTIDGLPVEALERIRKSPRLAPTIASLMKRGTSFLNTFSSGQHTQMAIAPLLTSTNPMDYGGYQFGVANRPVTLAEVLEESGYQTFGTTTGGAVTSLYGCNRGLQTFLPFATPNLWTSDLYIHQLNYYNKLPDARARRKYWPHLVEFVGVWLRQFVEHAGIWASPFGKSVMPPVSPGLREYEGLRGHLGHHLEAYLENPDEYVRKLHKDPGGHGLFRAIREHGTLVRWPLVTRIVALAVTLSGWFLSPSSWKWAVLKQTFRRAITTRTARTGSATSVRKCFETWHSQICNIDAPWFGWLHFFEVHDTCSVPYDQEPAVEQRGRRDVVRHAFRNFLYFRKHAQPTLDAAIGYVDRELGIVLEQVENADSNTVIVLHSDHGKAGVPPREQPVSIGQDYDELFRTGVVLVGPGFEENRALHPLRSTMDIAPTILKAAGVSIPNSMQGRTLDEVPYPHVYMESMGPGPVDIDNKRILVSARTALSKAKVSMHIYDSKPTLEQVFDLEDDPDEKHPLGYPQKPDQHSAVDAAMNRALFVAQRLVDDGGEESD